MRGRVRRPALCALALALLAAATGGARAHLAPDAPDSGDASRTAHMSPMPFLMNVRYGRSAPGPDRRHMEPRADRFFMGSRYGKRSHSVEEWEGEGEEEVEAALVCHYTGVMALYQCYRTRDRDHGGWDRDHGDWDRDHGDWDPSREEGPSSSLRGRR